MIRNLFTSFVFFVAFNAFSMPKIHIKHQRNAQGFAQVQVSNSTREVLLCYVAIDGYKIKFRLNPLEPSQWYSATDTRFNHKNFSVWCDYLAMHSEYQE